MCRCTSTALIIALISLMSCSEGTDEPISNFLAKWGTEGSGDGQFIQPYGVAVDVSGNAYVADTMNNRVQKFDSDGNFLAKWGNEGSGDEQFDYPFGVAIGVSGNVYVADSGNRRTTSNDPRC